MEMLTSWKYHEHYIRSPIYKEIPCTVYYIKKQIHTKYFCIRIYALLHHKKNLLVHISWRCPFMLYIYAAYSIQGCSFTHDADSHNMMSSVMWRCIFTYYDGQMPSSIKWMCIFSHENSQLEFFPCSLTLYTTYSLQCMKMSINTIWRCLLIAYKKPITLYIHIKQRHPLTLYKDVLINYIKRLFWLHKDAHSGCKLISYYTA